ncbi:hypothetical protein [Endozoicomonas sp. GU-1]|uniref:hypothetical protein n=1 Tax=Endozoicomonas sp. GU-1 TaxID=3009078 RepID=UPI0022B4CE40|nr:hypothetical protein [Endozoicomonas sp. GU-1]WBA80492.1 hypothetical protein O2T12_19455 [Endozoicomonas sp. GU-1]WBA88056.1 hypothetical protein O3276_08655 [Endozoicomonas sp. GU-1]
MLKGKTCQIAYQAIAELNGTLSELADPVIRQSTCPGLVTRVYHWTGRYRRDGSVLVTATTATNSILGNGLWVGRG